MTTHARILSIRTDSARPMGWTLLVVGVAALLLAFGTRLAAPVEEAAPASRSASVAAVARHPSAGSGCWVTGDVVGDANPLQVYAIACGASGAQRRDRALP
jgi:hypothetical protein